ncbi:MAG: phosphoribosylamine--glycine ligase [Synergistaceae bacterium]|jgi:phosphoribosylamine--glycine ligase|nr:phosphoribosylamine--glycine ligase [Synergistaceae bacterium]
MKKILIVGSGGREHALAWKLARSPQEERKLYAAPGNPGMEALAECVPIDVMQVDDLVAFAGREGIDLVLVGPEAPLAAGLADRLREKGIFCFGPGAQGTLLESSKRHAREFMARHGIPSPVFRAFTSLDEAGRYLESLPDDFVVVKADGLAQGKGVVVAQNRKEALAALDEMMGNRRFGDAGKEVLIEECLTGEEVSLLTFTDGNTILPMLPVQDHKRVGDGDSGPNTGGMGTYAPASVFSPEIARQVESEILRPLRDALQAEKIDYRGCLYIGLMLTPKGPKVIEFNARFGDPETQVLMPLLKSDLFEVLYACARGKLSDVKLEWSEGSAVCVVMASRGYPGKYPTGLPITETLPGGVEAEEFERNSWVFHAGTSRNKEGGLITAGGRVLGVTAAGATFEEALRRVYARVETLHFEGQHFRRDIAYREVKRRRGNRE